MGSRVSKIKRYQIRVEGIVQGVGFRPFIYRLATERDYSGYVLNDSKGVLLEIQGEQVDIDKFCQSLKQQAPPASYIATVNYLEIPIEDDEQIFVIKKVLKVNQKKR